MVETAGFAGSTAGGMLGETAAYLACNVVFVLPSGGTSLLWCGLIAGGIGGYLGGKYVKLGAQKGAALFYDGYSY